MVPLDCKKHAAEQEVKIGGITFFPWCVDVREVLEDILNITGLPENAEICQRKKLRLLISDGCDIIKAIRNKK
jgi:hypothetical protein